MLFKIKYGELEKYTDFFPQYFISVVTVQKLRGHDYIGLIPLRYFRVTSVFLFPIFDCFFFSVIVLAKFRPLSVTQSYALGGVALRDIGLFSTSNEAE